MPDSIRGKIARFYQSEIRLSLKVIATSLVVGVASALPLLLYVAVGPADGNPVGLGLLAFAGVFLAQLGLVVGLLRMAWELFAGRH